MPNFPNLPKVETRRGDGNLKISTTDSNPQVLLLGTAAIGPGDVPFNARDLGAARQVFGQSSELYKGLVECKKAYGAPANIWLYRIGTEPATLQIGTQALSSGVVKILVQDRRADIGTTYKASYYQPSGHLWVYNELGTLIYSNSPNNSVDLGEIEIRGDLTAISGEQFGDPTNGTLALSETLAAIGTANATCSFTAATIGPADGNLLARYEALQDAYRLLETQDLDLVVPLGVYFDEPNVAYYTSGVDDDTAANPNNPFWFPSGTLQWFKQTAPAEGSRPQAPQGRCLWSPFPLARGVLPGASRACREGQALGDPRR